MTLANRSGRRLAFPLASRPWGLDAGEQVFEYGMHLDFLRGLYYTKAAGSPQAVGELVTAFPFTRNSARNSYRGSDGLLKYANENQFQQSQSFDDVYWTKSQVTVVANNQTAPDGTATADTITEDNTSNIHVWQRGAAVIGLVQTLSIFVKAGTASWCAVQLGSASAFFNAATGAWGTIDASLTASMESWGNGWYRLIVTGRPVNTDCIFFIANGDLATNYLGTLRTLYAWGAQLQMGNAAGPYLATVASAKYDQPRFNHYANGVRRGLMLEGGRTNLILQSEDLATTWTAANAAVAVNSIASPTGDVNADRITEDATAATNHYVTQGISKAASAIQYAASAFFKAGTKGFAHLRIANGALTSGAGVGINLSTGALGAAYSFGGSPFTGVNAYVEAWANGWYRVILIATSDAASTTLATLLMLATGTASGNVTFNGDGASYIYAWGAQVESAVPTASSYIPTTTGSLARAADRIPVAIGSWFNASAGTVVVNFDMSISGSGNSRHVWSAHDGTTNERILCQMTSGNIPRLFVADGGITQADITGALAVSTETPTKLAMAWAANDFINVLNGASQGVDAAGTLPTCTTFSVGNDTASAELYGHIASLDYWPERKPNDFLFAATR